jgi:hypothetical protein
VEVKVKYVDMRRLWERNWKHHFLSLLKPLDESWDLSRLNKTCVSSVGV